MTQKSAARLLARLTDLRLRKEDQARQKLAVGHSRKAAAAATLEHEELQLHRITTAIPAMFKLHLRQVKILDRPTDRFATLVQAVEADRRILTTHSDRADAAKVQLGLVEAEVETLRDAYMQALRRRQATEALGQIKGQAERKRQELREEDLAADQPRHSQQDITP
jgi:flagellar biosynthesis chaperone FliJ